MTSIAKWSKIIIFIRFIECINLIFIECNYFKYNQGLFNLFISSL